MAEVQNAPETPAEVAEDVIMRAEQVTKVFDATVALNGVNFNVYRGKVNVLVGENGAGKSTLMKILAGVERPTEGHLTLEGKEVHFNWPREAAAQGIGIIYQELNLFPNLSVTENIFMARELRTAGVSIDKRAEDEITRKLIARLEQPIAPHTLAGDLPLGQQQIVEIAKALATDVRILIMDEPTSALSTAEVTVLFRIINELRSQGVSIIYISHKLDELLQIGDYVTVLRDGRLVAEAPASQVNVSWIIEKMVGREKEALFDKWREHAIGEELLRVEGMTLPKQGGGFALNNVSFSLRAGEILGIYGLMGAGRTELFECLAGLHPEAAGDIWLGGRKVKTRTVAGRLGLGLVLVPEDRQRAGLVQTMSVAENMVLASLRNYIKWFYLSKKTEEVSVHKLIKDLSIKVANPEQPITSLSGGNQQKVVVAKGLLTSPKVLLLDEPTRGIDVAAKADVFEIMTQLAMDGFGVLFVSTELKEVMAMADRILVMSRGEITGEFTRAEANEEDLVAASAVGHGPVKVEAGAVA